MKTLHTRLESPAFTTSEFEIVSIEGHEEISRAYAFSVVLLGHAGKTLDEDAVLASTCTLVFELDGVVARRVHGNVEQIESGLHEESMRVQWTLLVVPRASQLALTTTTEVSLDKSVPDILKDRLSRAGLVGGEDYELRLEKAYSTRDFVVQYKESHLDFIGRLTEHVGIAYFFKQTDTRDVAIFADANSAFVTEADGLRVAFRPRGEHLDVFDLSSITTRKTGKVRVRDYNYRTPTVELNASKGEGGADTEQFEYGAHFKTPEEASRVAEVRLEELAWQRRVFHGKSNRCELSPGTRFVLEGHPSGDKELLVIEVTHRLQRISDAATSMEQRYENEFRAIDASVPFRPLRRTAKPFVPGVITGVVEASQPGEYAELDDDGRYHVRFAFDTSAAQRGKASRPIRMAQPHGGAGYGMHFPLRNGVEVILACVEGDPDRPIISGAVPNPTTPSTVGAKNSARNVIRTGGGSEINIDDRKGSERVKITVPFGNTIFQLGAPNVPNEGVYVGTDKKVHIASSEGMGFVDGVNITATAPVALVHGTTDATLQGDANANVTSAGHVTVQAPKISNVAGAVHEESAPVITSTAAGVWSASSGAVAIVHGGATVTITSPVITIEGSSMTLRGDTISIHATGAVNVTGDGSVNVSGPTVNVAGGGVVNVTGATIKLNA